MRAVFAVAAGHLARFTRRKVQWRHEWASHADTGVTMALTATPWDLGVCYWLYKSCRRASGRAPANKFFPSLEMQERACRNARCKSAAGGACGSSSAAARSYKGAGSGTKKRLRGATCRRSNDYRRDLARFSATPRVFA